MKKNIMIFEKKETKNFFRKTGPPAKPEYPEDLESSDLFFIVVPW